MADDEDKYYFTAFIETKGADGKVVTEQRTVEDAPYCNWTEDKQPIPFTGFAIVRYANKDSYEGQYVSGKKCGKGIYRYFSNGNLYDGHWKDDMKHGPGKMEYFGEQEDEEGDDAPKKVSQGEYNGYWENDRRHGEGMFVYKNGDTYSGWWKYGNKNGKGTFTNKSTGMKLIGDWSNGQIKTGRWVYANGFYYEGSFENNQPAGEGTWYCKDGNVVKGCFKQK